MHQSGGFPAAAGLFGRALPPIAWTIDHPEGPLTQHVIGAAAHDSAESAADHENHAHADALARGAPSERGHELFEVRLGIASSLFSALRHRHPPTAAHSLRVTLGCATWALVLGLSDEQRDILEVAALLHDLGKIGLPDSLLHKSGPLGNDELAVVEQCRQHGVAILRSSCASPAILDIVRYSSAWYDGSQAAFEWAGADIPLGARLLGIVDAFDAMTWDQPSRASSKERAFAELFAASGTRFDPELVRVFAALHECDHSHLHELVAQRWLEMQDQELAGALWRLAPSTAASPETALKTVFQQTLLENMRDAVVFIDAGLRITLWNSGAERMTGIFATSVLDERFVPGLLELRDDDGAPVPLDQCFVAEAILSAEQQYRRLTIRGRNQKDIAVEAHVVPVVAADGVTQGVTLVMHDVSPETSLEARCHSLHDMATMDPLTRVANRAEFNRVHAMFVSAHLERQLPCSLIIADIDHFKYVNDTFGHQAGDEVLKSFAKLLNSSCRPGDLVARYGGEEFVILCADCDNPTAARRAEGMRKRISQLSQSSLDQKRIMCSFGVTELQLGDTPETMVARADRALYDAKAAGRNTVVQLGAGLSGTEPPDPGGRASGTARANLLAEQDLVTSVPMSMAIEKLRGFVADQDAQIMRIDNDEVQLKVGRGGGFFSRRQQDRGVPLIVDLRFFEDKQAASSGGRNCVRTRIRAEIRPLRNRDRRRGDAVERASQILASLRAYLMASEDVGGDSDPSMAAKDSGRSRG